MAGQAAHLLLRDPLRVQMIVEVACGIVAGLKLAMAHSWFPTVPRNPRAIAGCTKSRVVFGSALFLDKAFELLSAWTIVLNEPLRHDFKNLPPRFHLFAIINQPILPELGQRLLKW